MDAAPANSDQDSLLEASYEAVRKRVSTPDWADSLGTRLTEPLFVGEELDGLAIDVHPEHWSASRHAALAALRAIRPWQKLAVLGMAQDEAPYLLEWVAHYLAIGADKIFIYSNDNTDGTDRVLRWLGAHAAVKPIFTAAAKGVNIQHKNYQHALFLLPELRLFDWVLIVDIDEFLVPAAQYGHDLPTLLKAAPEDTDAIVFPWRWRLWDRAFQREEGLLAERYPHAVPHSGFKPVTRLRHVYSLMDIHAPRLEPGTMRDTSFADISDRTWAPDQKSEAGGWIDHYWSKSFEEFLVKKTRGDRLAAADLSFQRGYETFFTWTQSPTGETLFPVPAALLAAQKRILTGLKVKPGYAALQAEIDERYATYAAGIRADSAITAVYEEYLRRFPL